MGNLLTILLLLVSAAAQAATYYVDYSGGSDASAGTSTGAAWKRCPGDSEYTGSGSLAAGDTVRFKGGVSYIFTDADTNGITLTSGVTYDGNSAGTWGTGKATITDNNNATGHIAFYATATVSNIVIRHFIITQLGGSATLPTDPGSAVPANSGYGVKLGGGAQNISVLDCDMSKLGYYFNQKPMDASTSIDGGGVFCFPDATQSWGNITVSNCNFSLMRVGCAFSCGSYLTNVVVDHCSFSSNMVWCIDLNVRTTGTFTDGITIRNCDFFNFWQFNLDYWTGYGEGPHTDGIFFRCDYSGAIYGTNNNFYNNRFYSTTNNGGGTAQIYVTEGPSCNIYNNVFLGSGFQDGNISLNDGPLDGSNNQLVRIFNNTFYDSYTYDLTVNNRNALTRPIGKVWAANNLYYDAMTGSGNNFVGKFETGSIGWTWGVTNWFINANLYRSQNWTSNYVYSANSWGEGNIADMQLYGWETNGIADDPKFADISAGLATDNVLANDLSLQTNSPAIGAGTNLTTLAAYLPGLATDFAGNSRPASGNWTIGAYEGASAGGNIEPGPTTNSASTMQVIGGIYAGSLN